MKFWRYIEVHHEEFGVAMFVLPALLAGMALVGAGYGISWLVHSL